MSVRKHPGRGQRKNVGKFFSVKMGVMLSFESLLEMSLMYLLDYDPAVSFFKEQPCRIHYVRNGRKRTYTPDLLVVREGRRQIVEVKPAKKAAGEKNLQLFNSVAPICARGGFEFLVVTDEAILQQPRLDNVKALWRYARTPLRPQHRILCDELFDGRRDVALEDLCNLFAARGVPRHVVYALIYWGALDFDLTQPLRPDSSLRLSSDAAPPAGREF